jgi:hypothetical protein
MSSTAATCSITFFSPPGPSAHFSGTRAGGDAVWLARKSASEIADLKSVRWCDALTAVLAEFGKTHADLANTAKGADWKIAVARTLRETVAPSYGGLAEHLCMGKAASLRVYLSRGN